MLEEVAHIELLHFGPVVANEVETVCVDVSLHVGHLVDVDPALHVRQAASKVDLQGRSGSSRFGVVVPAPGPRNSSRTGRHLYRVAAGGRRSCGGSFSRWTSTSQRI